MEWVIGGFVAYITFLFAFVAFWHKFNKVVKHYEDKK